MSNTPHPQYVFQRWTGHAKLRSSCSVICQFK
jgi:hypothetical protein